MRFPDTPFSGFEDLSDIAVTIRGAKEDEIGLLYSPAECTLYLCDGQLYSCPYNNDKFDRDEELDIRSPTQVADALLSSVNLLPYDYDNFVITDMSFKFDLGIHPGRVISLYDLDKDTPDRNLYDNLKLFYHIELWEGVMDVTEKLRFTFFEIYEFLSKNFKKEEN